MKGNGMCLLLFFFKPGLDMIQKNGGFCCFYPKLAWIKRQRIPVSPIEKFEKAVWVKDLNYMTKGLNRIHAASKFIFPSTVRPAAVTYSSGSSHKKIGLQKKLSFCRVDHHTPEPWHTWFSGLSWLFHRAFSVFCFIFFGTVLLLSQIWKVGHRWYPQAFSVFPPSAPLNFLCWVHWWFASNPDVTSTSFSSSSEVSTVQTPCWLMMMGDSIHQ